MGCLLNSGEVRACLLISEEVGVSFEPEEEGGVF